MASVNVERWRSLVEAYFPSNVVESMLSIMELESGGNPDAHNPGTPQVPEDSWGLFQINRHAWGSTPGALRDPETNIRMARQVYNAQGFGAWFRAATQLGLLTGSTGPARQPTPGMPEPGLPGGPGPAAPVLPVPVEPPRLPDIGGAAEEITGAVNRLGTAIATLPSAPLAYLQDAAETLTWLGQQNVWLRIGLVLLGAVVLLLGLGLFGLSFIPKETAAAVTSAAAKA